MAYIKLSLVEYLVMSSAAFECQGYPEDIRNYVLSSMEAIHIRGTTITLKSILYYNVNHISLFSVVGKIRALWLENWENRVLFCQLGKIEHC